MEEITLLKAIASDIAEIKEDLKTMNGRQREDHDRITKVEERLNLWSLGQIAVSLLLSSLAAWLGMRK
jgi:hypothetical protein